MIVLMFQPHFAEMVEHGRKCQTIRPVRKRPICAGDVLSLRTWTSAPYRSNQRILGGTVCQSVQEIVVAEDGINIEGRELLPVQRETLATDDGFASFHDMLIWFQRTHSLPFGGVLIRWERKP